MTQIQVSIGNGSLGMMYRAVSPADLPALIELCAAHTAQTVESVTAKLEAGKTLWLNRLEERTIRGYDAEAAAQRAALQTAARAQRASADGYFSNYR